MEPVPTLLLSISYTVVDTTNCEESLVRTESPTFPFAVVERSRRHLGGRLFGRVPRGTGPVPPRWRRAGWPRRVWRHCDGASRSGDSRPPGSTCRLGGTRATAEGASPPRSCAPSLPHRIPRPPWGRERPLGPGQGRPSA